MCMGVRVGAHVGDDLRLSTTNISIGPQIIPIHKHITFKPPTSSHYCQKINLLLQNSFCNAEDICCLDSFFLNHEQISHLMRFLSKVDISHGSFFTPTEKPHFYLDLNNKNSSKDLFFFHFVALISFKISFFVHL